MYVFLTFQVTLRGWGAKERILFLHLPASLPSVKRSSSTEFNEMANNSKPSKVAWRSEKCYTLEELPLGLMGTYSYEEDAFRIGDKLLKLSEKDIALTFGLPLEGKMVQVFPRNIYKAPKSDFYLRNFEGEGVLQKSVVVDAIKNSLIRRDMYALGDFVKLVIMYMAATTFFPSAAGTLASSFIQHVDDFDTIKGICWPSVIQHDLMSRKEAIAQSLQRLHDMFCSFCTSAWASDDLTIKGFLLEDLMFNRFISDEIIDWFTSYLRENDTNNAKSKFFGAMCKTFVTQGNEKYVKIFLEDVLEEVDDDVEFCFFPMNTQKTIKSKEGYHWTLLKLDWDTWEWLIFNSMKPRSGSNKYIRDAETINGSDHISVWLGSLPVSLGFHC
ncbi:hypothetical protein IFM89_011307 [Coptis chinensis]|uniref:Ubiquitin-like protease family profile domain-containing protein n=1 Tax=Coptis chinensis TaxID=261450 RepID=A0A835HQ63_9MAGN|nr:hypothetical protein IFM89_011307 [Coptis chinensis]